MRSNLNASLTYVLSDEGSGLNLSASEPGGASKYGVSLTALDDWYKVLNHPRATVADVAAIDDAKARAFYAARFCEPIRFDELPVGVDYRLLDIEINLGPTGGILALQAALGQPATGKMSDALLAKAKAQPADKLIQALSDAWMAKKRQSSSWSKYGPGWTNRNTRATARALAMLQKPAAPAPTPVSVPASPSPPKPAAPAPEINTMWQSFDKTPYSKDAFTARVARLNLNNMRWVKFITLHNTAAPTLVQWAESGPAHDARIVNLQYFYEKTRGWHSGPHLFISRTVINGFSNLEAPGVHASCFNTKAIGIEMVGDYATEAFDTGDGAKVKDMTIHALAALHNRLGLRPDGYEYGVKGLHFHVDCRHDNHDCPGKHVNRADMVRLVLARMAELRGQPIPPLPAPPPAAPVHDAKWVQHSLNQLGFSLVEDGDLGPKSEAAIRKFQADHGLKADGDAGPLTKAAIEGALKK